MCCEILLKPIPVSRLIDTIWCSGVNVGADTGEFLCQLTATDPDAGDNATLAYMVMASHLYRAGSNVSAGSVVPSPFSISPHGRLFTATLVAEYNQDRFLLEVVARETAQPFREAKATVHVSLKLKATLVSPVLPIRSEIFFQLINWGVWLIRELRNLELTPQPPRAIVKS